MCSSIFLENSRLYFPFLFTDRFKEVVPMILGATCLNTFILDEEVGGTLSAITKEETFRKFYQNISYPNPIRL